LRLSSLFSTSQADRTQCEEKCSALVTVPCGIQRTFRWLRSHGLSTAIPNYTLDHANLSRTAGYQTGDRRASRRCR
jgi:hypothetical protein